MMLHFAKFYKIQIFLIWIPALSLCQEKISHSGLKALFPHGLNESLNQISDKLRTGVEIDPGFVPIGDELSPGCPSPITGNPWVLHQNSSKCYLVGFQGPCPQNMKMFREPQNRFGNCQCDCFHDNGATPVQNYCHGDKLDRKVFQESWAFYEKTGLCYKLYSQGPCPLDEWLIMDNAKTPAATCAKRACPYAATGLHYSFTFFSMATNSCHRVPEPCEEKEEAGEKIWYRYYFTEGSWIPSCVPAERRSISSEGNNGWTKSNLGSIQKSGCRESEVYSAALGKCVVPLRRGKSLG